MKFTYKDAGVNIDVADATKKSMALQIDGHDTSGRVMNKVGAFAALYNIQDLGLEEPILVLKTEEPGSKQKLAIQNGKIENICYDMINHLTNDIIVMGAKPLTVQDAIICGKLEPDIVKQLVKYISEACSANGSVLTGGETSEQPGVLSAGTYVLTSSIVGVVDKKNIIDGSAIVEGDTVLALASNGIHTNGYSFLRKLMEVSPDIKNEIVENETFLDFILKPHRSYYKEIKEILAEEELVGMAHITGGGIIDNLARILPEDLNADINLSKIKVLPIFKLIKKYSNAEDTELLRTFNMGVGMVLVVKKGSAAKFIEHFNAFNLDCYEIGKIVKGNKKVTYSNTLSYN